MDKKQICGKLPANYGRKKSASRIEEKIIIFLQNKKKTPAYLNPVTTVGLEMTTELGFKEERTKTPLQCVCGYHACLQAQRNNTRDGILDNKHTA